MDIRIDLEKCTGCKLCIKACPYGSIEIIDKKAVIDASCNLCGACVESCKFEAIVMPERKRVASSEHRGVWVFAEQRRGQIASVVYELLDEGRRLADQLQTELSAVLLGHEVKEQAKTLAEYGVDKVYLCSRAELKDLIDENYAEVISQMIVSHKPEVVLAGATSAGRSLIPKIAARLETGLTADCTRLEVDSNQRLLLQTRPAFGGNIMATIICPEKKPQMATVRPHVMKKAEGAKSGEGKVISYKPKSLPKCKVKIVDFIEDLAEKVKLEEAEIIVSGGRGLGGMENFKVIRELAETLGAAVGASRAAVDAEWISYPHQVGQTGKTVCPKVYFACGISGAIQHLAGMQTSEIIVAINKDPQAPIFQVATYGLVGDLFEIVPALTKKFRETLGK